MSQKDLAGIAGVKPPSVNEWKNKGTMPRADTALKIADYFNVSVKWLITGMEETGLTQNERLLLRDFQQLDSEEQGYILDYIQWRISKKGNDLEKTGTENLAPG